MPFSVKRPCLIGPFLLLCENLRFMPKLQQKIELGAQARTVLGHKVKRLRRSGFVPAVLYGKGLDAVSLQVPYRDFERVLKQAGESSLVYLTVDGGPEVPTIIHDVTRDALKDTFVHADFYKVRLDQKIKAKVAVAFHGESPAVKEQAGIFVRNINELEVEAFPQDLPPEIAVDISSLKNFGDQVLVKDLKLPVGVELTASPDDIIATVQEPISEEELAAELAEPTTDVSAVEEVEKEKKEEEVPEEGKEGAEDKAPTIPAEGKKE